MSSVGYFILWYLSVLGAWGFNVDTEEPIVRGLPDQYASASQNFGYQTVLHMLTVPDPGAGVEEFASQARIVVGAPRGNTSSLATGLVYVCPITPGSCQLLTNNTGDLADSMLEDNQVLMVNTSVEQKEGQLLGATMASSGDKFMVCAPLYSQVRGQQLWYTGKCFLSDRSLQNFSSHEFCGAEMSILPSVQCSAGLSLVGAGTSEGFLLGVPLFNEGLGKLVAYENEQYEEGVTGGSAMHQAQRGYQVAYGHITRVDKEQFVTVEYGENTVLGRVIVINPDDPGSRVMEVNIDGPNLPIDPNAQPGRQRPLGIAAGFGFAVATAKIYDKDYDSILVSAPFTSEGHERGEVGKVYVYQNSGGMLSSTNPSELMSREASFGRFGSAIANMGDINKDGYDDIAVSAPYEGSGVVYIYHSRADGSGLNPVSVQQIAGDALNTGALENLVGFGTTLSSGVDVDGNKYNDLLVGSFESQKVVVLRTCPIVNVNATLATILRGDNKALNLDDLKCGENACFDVEVCITVEPTGLNGSAFEGPSVEMNYTLELESSLAAMGLPRRSFFKNSSTHILEQSVTVPNNHVALCQNHTVLIQKAVTNRESPFDVSLRVQGNPPPVSKSDGNQPIFDLISCPKVISPEEQFASVEPQRDCGDDLVCNPQLSLKVVDVTYANTQFNETESITVWVQVNNTGEDSFITNLFSTFNSELFTLSQILTVSNPNCTDVTDNPANVSRRRCLIANPLRSNSVVSAGVKFRLSQDKTFTESNYTLKFNVSSAGEGKELNTTDNTESTTVTVNRVADLIISRIGVTPDRKLTLDDTIVRPDVLTSLSQLGPSASIQVDVFNEGPSAAPGANLTITWPLRAADPGPYILYPSSLNASSGVDCSMEHIDPEELNSRNRQRRQATSEDAAITGDVSLACSDPTIQCVLIVCTLGRIPSDTIRSVTINSALDIKYFLDKPDMNVRIPVEASVNIVADYPVSNPPNRDASTMTITAEYRPGVQAAPAAVLDLWIIIVIVVSIVVFILLLGISIVVLYCLGFFRRKRYQHPAKGNPTAVLETVPDGDECPSTPEKKEAKVEEAEGGRDEPDAPTKSPSLTSLDITLEMKTPETDV